MKCLISGLAVLMGLSLTVSTMAQSKVPTPTVGHISYNSNSHTVVKNPALHTLHGRFRQILVQIQKDLESKKITASQASDFHNQVKAVRVQEINWLKESGTKTLTSDQITKLNQQLDTIVAGL